MYSNNGVNNQIIIFLVGVMKVVKRLALLLND